MYLVVFLALGAFGLAGVSDADAARKQALVLFNIFKQKDWRGLYYVVEFSAAVKPTVTDADAFARDVDKGIRQSDPDYKTYNNLFDHLDDIAVGVAVVENGHARVATSCRIAFPGKSEVTFLGIVTLVKVGDMWKWDLTFTDNTKGATEQRFTELLGQASTSSP